jgi:hypothetical protein
MRHSWTGFFRRLAATFMVCGVTAWTSAMCYAQSAADSAADPVYADGWQAGDNGGSGFTPWNFDTDTIFMVTPGIQTIDSTSPFNQIGTAWTIANPTGGLPRAGRGFPALEVGQTLNLVVDNPGVTSPFFKGYFIRLNGNTGGVGGNICYGNMPCTSGASPVGKLNIRQFNYGMPGRWDVVDGGDDAFPDDPTDFNFTPLYDNDTDGGMRLSVTLTSADTYLLIMDPLDSTDNTHCQTGRLANPLAPLD